MFETKLVLTKTKSKDKIISSFQFHLVGVQRLVPHSLPNDQMTSIRLFYDAKKFWVRLGSVETENRYSDANQRETKPEWDHSESMTK